MKQNQILKVLILTIILAQTVSALDPMYDYRYTLGPEIVVPGAFHIGLGGWTHYNEDLTVASNLQIGLTNEFEIGLKYMIGTNQKWITAKPDDRRNRDHSHSLIDIGAKYALSPHISLQADIPMAINRDMEWSGIISITQYSGFAKNVSFMYEGRFGFGDLPGEDSYVKPMASVTPFFQIGQSIRVSIGVITSFSIGATEDFKNDFMLDVLPRIEVGFSAFRLNCEIARGILTYNAVRHNRYALFVVSDI
ncbi:MAG: hypothetical protein LBH25_12410 [Fibromonadaceae bacterium]|jgi:hypothetical protein|nr:hypothetical protein [Fibromonadaceae bacterium]